MFLFDKHSARNWTHIIIHHSWSQDSGNIHNWQEIGAYHTKVKGWNAIGYHFAVQKVDNSYRYCIGRGLDCVGAHTQGMNDVSVGICLIGEYDTHEPIDAQYWMIAELCKDLMRDFNIPIENIRRHSEYAPKSCPGTRFDMNKLFDKIKNNGYHDPFSLGSEVKDEKVNPVDGIGFSPVG